jgi:hypothetical protein
MVDFAKIKIGDLLICFWNQVCKKSSGCVCVVAQQERLETGETLSLLFLSKANNGGCRWFFRKSMNTAYGFNLGKYSEFKLFNPERKDPE